MLDRLKVRAITLDLDDTLWPIWPTIARAEQALQDWLRHRAPRTADWMADDLQRHRLREQIMNSQSAADLHALVARWQPAQVAP